MSDRGTSRGRPALAACALLGLALLTVSIRAHAVREGQELHATRARALLAAPPARATCTLRLQADRAGPGLRTEHEAARPGPRPRKAVTLMMLRAPPARVRLLGHACCVAAGRPRRCASRGCRWAAGPGPAAPRAPGRRRAAWSWRAAARCATATASSWPTRSSRCASPPGRATSRTTAARPASRRTCSAAWRSISQRARAAARAARGRARAAAPAHAAPTAGRRLAYVGQPVTEPAAIDALLALRDGDLRRIGLEPRWERRYPAGPPRRATCWAS